MLIPICLVLGRSSCFQPLGAFSQRSHHLSSILPSNYQEYGNECIERAAALCGASKDQLTIEWKNERIVITVSGNAYASADEEEEKEEGAEVPSGVDVTSLARAINAALDDGSVGLAIAEAHEIEVTTPGISGELTGLPPQYLASYIGFDVIVRFKEPTKGSIKTLEGRFVERNDEVTIINVKGRMKKLRNKEVLSLALPKAKKEKGVR